MAGYSHSDIKVMDRASSGSSSTYHLGLYSGTDWGNLALRIGAAYSWHDLSTNRAVTIPGVSDSLSAGMDLGGTRIEPFANLAHASLHNDRLAEQGGAAALNGEPMTTGVTFTTLGLRAEHNLALGTVDATLRGMVGWRHAFRSNAAALTSGAAP